MAKPSGIIRTFATRISNLWSSFHSANDASLEAQDADAETHTAEMHKAEAQIDALETALSYETPSTPTEALVLAVIARNRLDASDEEQEFVLRCLDGIIGVLERSARKNISELGLGAYA